MSPIEFIGLADNLPFAVALGIMLALGVLSAIGVDGDADATDIPLLNWVNPGHLPMLMNLALFLGVYGLLGLAGQQTILALTGRTLDALPAGLSVLFPAMAVHAPIARLASRILPSDETSAIMIEQLIGRRGRIVVGTAYRDHPARALFVDDHAQQHRLMVVPSDDEASIGEDAHVLLTGIEKGVGRIIAVEPDPYLKV